MDDSVAVDAKRILLRYGAPISILDDVPDEKRVEFARAVSRTALPEREKFLRKLLADNGFGPPDDGKKSKSSKKKTKK